MNIDLIIPAAGIGSRFGSDVKKQFFLINNKPILYYTIKIITEAYPFSKIIIGIDKNDEEIVTKIYEDTGTALPLILTEGGSTRAETVYNCLDKATGDMVVIHDAVRPFVLKKNVEEVINKASDFGGAICALKVRDTLKSVINGSIDKTLPRDGLYLAHTPQVFNTEMLKSALWEVIAEKSIVTDESLAFERAGYRVEIAGSSPENIKVTYAEDIELLKLLVFKYFKESNLK